MKLEEEEGTRAAVAVVEGDYQGKLRPTFIAFSPLTYLL